MTFFRSRSVADITEADFIGRLLQDAFWRSRVFNIYGMPADPSAFASVDLKGAPGHFFGDVDVLLCPPTQPELATAISVKRIKFGASAIRNGQPNKLGKLKKADEQANRLAAVGFHLVLLLRFRRCRYEGTKRGHVILCRIVCRVEATGQARRDSARPRNANRTIPHRICPANRRRAAYHGQLLWTSCPKCPANLADRRNDAVGLSGLVKGEGDRTNWTKCGYARAGPELTVNSPSLSICS
jgi:hypothetical protein